MTLVVGPAVRRARWAVAATFAINGAVIANLVPRFPELVDRLDLTNAAFGTAVAAWPLGALVSGVVVGVAVQRWTSRRVIVGASLVMLVLFALVAWAPGWWALALLFLGIGLVDALIDIANNAQGLWVQRRLGTSIITGLHGAWSVGAVVGGVMGSVAAGLAVPIPWHLGGVALALAIALVLVGRLLLAGHEPHPEHEADAVAAPVRPAPRTILLLVLIGVVGLAGAAGEDAGNTWGALYLTGDLGTSAAVGGAAFIAMQTAMIVGRFVGDPLVNRFGARAVSRDGALLTMAGLVLVIAVPHPVAAIAGFGVMGLGVAALIPLAMHAADELPGLRRGVGLTAAGWMMRLGFLLSPPIVGLIADGVGLRWGFLVPVVVAVAAVACAQLLAPLAPRG